MGVHGPAPDVPEAALDVCEIVDRCARADGSADLGRIASRGLQALLSAEVAVCTSAAFRGTLRSIAASATLLPRSHNPGAVDGLRRGGRALLVTTQCSRRLPSYLIWRASPFSRQETLAVDGLGLVLVALHVRFHAAEARPQAAAPVASEELTRRELAMLQDLARGLSAESIARRHAISPRTVRKHLQHVYAKLGAHDRLLAVDRARAQGLLVGDRDDPTGG